jgi:3-deoxy-7-phosphoheptulonate synthase
MRTDPKSFQGLGRAAFEAAHKVSRESGLPLVSEVSDPRQIEELYDFVDVFQVGTRNMYNYSLLKELGKLDRPVLLKRGFSALVEEWLYAAEYVSSEGNSRVILCERGIRTFERATRNTLDLSAVAFVKQRSGLPVVVDPSHGTGVRSLVEPMALAAVAAGADGLLIEVHPSPENALSDGAQTLNFAEFDTLMAKVKAMLPLFSKQLSRADMAPEKTSSPSRPNSEPGLSLA